MAIKHDYLVQASKAKRMATMFRGVNTTIPVEHDGKMVNVPAQAIAAACEKCKDELLEDFCSFLSANEVISQAYRIANIQRRRESRAEYLARKERELAD